MEILSQGESCLCDFTFDFYWQHQGTRLNPDAPVNGGQRASYRALVEALKRGEDVLIKGDVGDRLASSLGVDLASFGGTGGPIEGTGRVVVDGDAGKRMGISMISGSIYLSGRPTPPLGNVIEVESDMTGYRKYVSITEVLAAGPVSPEAVLAPNSLSKRGLVVSDGTLRETVGARCASDKEIVVKGDAGMSAGILMRSGRLLVKGDSGRNTGVLMCGGMLVIAGDTGDFTATEMRGGEIFVKGRAGNFTCPKMRGGAVYARDAKPVSPARAVQPDQDGLRKIAAELELSPLHAMMYRKFCLQP